MSFECIPAVSFFRPGESIALAVTCDVPVRGLLDATVYHLADQVATWRGPMDGKDAMLINNLPPDPRRGAFLSYGVKMRLLDEQGSILAETSTAFDVLEHWTQAPRYGFLCDFAPGRPDEAETMRWAASFHLNGLQYYDWQYRHETLLAPVEPYTDLLGRALSLDTVNRLIAAGHGRRIAAMPYTAVYGASAAFYRDHPQWALFEYGGQPCRLGDDFLMIMDPSPDTPWTAHLLNEFGSVLEKTAFDGIHIDQYGTPKIARRHNGDRVDLAYSFPSFINQAADIVRQKRGIGATIFNAVGNWPIDTVAAADQDVVYIEVWPPYREFLDLHRIIVNAQQAGNEKPVILAAYIDPANKANWRLADAVIFASGAYHLELGEPGTMLADPYFPKYGRLDAESASILHRYYDFMVRYGEVLAMAMVDASLHSIGVSIDGKSVDGEEIAVIVRHGSRFETFSLINFAGLEHHLWDQELSAAPQSRDRLDVRISTNRRVARVWAASPDWADPGAIPLDWRQDSQQVSFRVPSLDYWTMIVLEYA